MHETIQESVSKIQFEKKDADKVLMAFEHIIRSGTLEGYDDLFRKRFAERAKLAAGGRVNVTELARDVLREMGQEDPVKKFE